MNRLSLIALMVLVLLSQSGIVYSSVWPEWSAGMGWTDWPGMNSEMNDTDEDCGCRPNRRVCFNVFCNFEARPGGQDKRKCQAAARFPHWVTSRGAEIWNDSSGVSDPLFEVKCDTDLLFTGKGHRWTTRHGTWIQGPNGPIPGLYIPRYSLEDGQRTVEADLDLPEGKLHGSCRVYTGVSLER